MHTHVCLYRPTCTHGIYPYVNPCSHTHVHNFIQADMHMYTCTHTLYVLISMYACTMYTSTQLCMREPSSPGEPEPTVHPTTGYPSAGGAHWALTRCSPHVSHVALAETGPFLQEAKVPVAKPGPPPWSSALTEPPDSIVSKAQCCPRGGGCFPTQCPGPPHGYLPPCQHYCFHYNSLVAHVELGYV